MSKINYSNDALEYIAKIADGGMRDAITLMDKCLSYDDKLTLDSVVKALGVADYKTMFDLNKAVFDKSAEQVVSIISDIHNSGLDIKQFIKNYFEFILDVYEYRLLGDLSQTKLPTNWEDELKTYGDEEWKVVYNMLEMLTNLQSTIKWEQNAKACAIAKFILFIGGSH